MDKNPKVKLGFFLGIIVTLFGLILRLGARWLAWPIVYDYTGPRENTEWASMERAISDVSLILMFFGLTLVVIAFSKWLRDETSSNSGA
jgi:hypothetical protein